MTLDETLEFLLEAREPEDYFEEHFGKLKEFTEENFVGTDLSVMDSIFQKILGVIEILKTNDRINFFVPRIKNKILYIISSKVKDKEQKEILEKMQRKVHKKLKSTESSPTTSPTIQVIYNEVEHFYKHSDIPPVNNFKFTGKDLSYSGAIEELSEIEERYNERAGKFLNPEEDDPDSVVLILQLKDSTGQYYEWYDLGVSSCPTKEAKLMKHCGSNERADSMLSLRVPLNKDQINEYNLTKEEAKKLRKPVLTFAVEGSDDDYTLVESHGISNQKPDEKYHEAIVALFEKEIITGINQRGAYRPELTFKLDDLNSELRKKMEDFGIEEEEDPTFDQDDIDAAQASIEEFNTKNEDSYFSIFAQEDSDTEYVEYGIPWEVGWFLTIPPEDFKRLGISLPDDYVIDWRFLNELEVVVEIDQNYGLRGYNEDRNEVYPSRDTLDSSVESIIWDVENYIMEKFYKNDLPKLIEKFPLNENYKSFGELKSEYLDESDIEVEFEDGLLTYSGDLITFNVELSEPLFIAPETKKEIKSKLEDDIEFVIYNKGRPDPNQLELDFSSVQQYIKDTKLLKEMVENYSEGLDFTFEVLQMKGSSNSIMVTLSYNVIFEEGVNFTDILQLFNHINKKEAVVTGRIERLVDELI